MRSSVRSLRATMDTMNTLTTSELVVAGEALVDLVISPDGAVEAVLGGAPYNTARAASRLGASVSFLGTLSNDRFGSMLAKQLVDDGVALLADRTERPTTLAAAELDEDGAASYRFYIAGTSAPHLDPASFGSTSSRVFFTGGLGLVLEPMATTLVNLVRSSTDETLVMIDVNCRPKIVDDRDAYLSHVDAVLERADIVKVSDDDLAYLWPGLDSLEAAELLLAKGPAGVLVTAGADTTSILVAGGRVDVPVPPLSAPLVDTIGAGDTFGGGFLSWWLSAGLGRTDVTRSNLERAVAAAHAAAAVVVTRRGANPPFRHELAADWS